MSILFQKSILIAFSILCLSNNLQAQSEVPAPEEIQTTILQLDSIFWDAYNNCDTEIMASFMTDDIEFYHDKGGLTTPLVPLVKTLKEGLCGDENFRLRRAPVEGSVKVFPMNNYGAIISGDHVFYVNEKGRKERLDGLAKFTHLWKYENKTWKMSRVLSYDHGPAPQANTKKAISLSDQILQLYTGQYEAPNTGTVTIQQEGTGLRMSAGEMKVSIFPESEQLFFVEGKDLTFEFVKNEAGQIQKMIVREDGQIVEEAQKNPINKNID